MIVYADNASTTQMTTEVIDAMISFMNSTYGNPSSLHSLGFSARNILNSARNAIASCIGADYGSEIIFTSGGTESDNQAIISATRIGQSMGKKHIITTPFEHPAVLNTVNGLKDKGFEVSFLNVSPGGIISLDELERTIKNDTCLVSIMTVNNEIGTIQPIEQIGLICKNKNVLFHTDAVQAVGHIDINVKRQNIDMLSASAHKFHGPKGSGFLYAKKNTKVCNYFEGGHQEFGKRPGTENIIGIVGMNVALIQSCNNMEKNMKKKYYLSKILIDQINKIPHSVLNGDPLHLIPGIVNFCFVGIEGEHLVHLLDQDGICVSTGSTCTSGYLIPSHVLTSIGKSDRLALSSLRLSISEENTIDDVEYIIKSINNKIEILRNSSTTWRMLLQGQIQFEI